MIVLHPNWTARRIIINRVKLTPEQVLQRRMFNQKRLVNLLRVTKSTRRKQLAAKIKLQIITSEVLRWRV